MQRPTVLCVGMLAAACVNQPAAVENAGSQQSGDRGAVQPQPSPHPVPAEVDPPPPVAPGEEGPGAAPAPSQPPAETKPPPPAR